MKTVFCSTCIVCLYSSNPTSIACVLVNEVFRRVDDIDFGLEKIVSRTLETNKPGSAKLNLAYSQALMAISVHSEGGTVMAAFNKTQCGQKSIRNSL